MAIFNSGPSRNKTVFSVDALSRATQDLDKLTEVKVYTGDYPYEPPVAKIYANGTIASVDGRRIVMKDGVWYDALNGKATNLPMDITSLSSTSHTWSVRTNADQSNSSNPMGQLIKAHVRYYYLLKQAAKIYSESNLMSPETADQIQEDLRAKLKIETMMKDPLQVADAETYVKNLSNEELEKLYYEYFLVE